MPDFVLNKTIIAEIYTITIAIAAKIIWKGVITNMLI